VGAIHSVVLSGEGRVFAFLLVLTGDAMPPKRGRAAAEAEDETAHEFRRHKSAVNEAMNEFLCPITFSLPVDPVMAEDGNVYTSARPSRSGSSSSTRAR